MGRVIFIENLKEPGKSENPMKCIATMKLHEGHYILAFTVRTNDREWMKNVVSSYYTPFALCDRRECRPRRYYDRRAETGCPFNCTGRGHRITPYTQRHAIVPLRRFEEQRRIRRPRYIALVNRWTGSPGEAPIDPRRKGNLAFDFRTMPSAFAGVSATRSRPWLNIVV